MKLVLKLLIVYALLAVVFCLGMFTGQWREQSMTDWHNNVSERLCGEKGLDITNGTIRGFYDYNGYYCVRTDTFWYDTKLTEKHEKLHALVREDYKHFCVDIPDKYKIIEDNYNETN